MLSLTLPAISVPLLAFELFLSSGFSRDSGGVASLVPQEGP